MNILVTGATGFLGQFLIQKLEAEGHNVVKINSKNADLTTQVSLNNFNSVKYDLIYHLAAWTQAGDFCLYHPGEQWVINQKINTNVLGWWSEFQPQSKFISMGTSCSYAPENQLIEKNYLLGEPIDSLYTYAHTKRMLQIGLQSLNKQYGLKYLTVVPSTLYGESYHNDGRQMHFIFDLIRKIIRGKEFGEEVILWGDGFQKRELIYVKDFVEALYFLSGISENEIINIGGGKEYTIREFADSICNIVGYDHSKIIYDTSKYTGAKSKFLSIEKLMKIYPKFSQISLESGLRKTIDWFYTSKAYLPPSN
ncbi:MAG: NAD-dependent epimerase/dehydratase family protein [Bacteroidota bacterium]|nr:NAD-dependent epimerase/dehydratase family protein [Bacteroidota bacterium]